ncbi:MAG: potassium channel protein [Synechococcales bacterium]|nr:potassium channel protein [Synechococcales bacterium]
MVGLLAFVAVTLIGTVGYRLIEGWRWIDAAYMTIITLATVGFSEVQPLDDRGRLFTISLILLGVISIGYIVNRFTEALIQGYFQEGLRLRQQRRLVEDLSQHYIICGFGRTGQQIATEFASEGISFVVIDLSVDIINQAQQSGHNAFVGDATLDETLIRAGIGRAVCLVAALPSDAENLYTVLSAKTLNPGIRAIARANTEEALQKLQRGGADAVVSPYITGGKRMAAAALRPQVMDFVDGILTGTDRSFYMEEFLIDPSTCSCVGQTLREARLRARSGALVLAVRRADGTLIAGPTADTSLQSGDLLICMGTAEQLRLLNQILSPIQSRPLRLPKQLSSDSSTFEF